MPRRSIVVVFVAASVVVACSAPDFMGTPVESTDPNDRADAAAPYDPAECVGPAKLDTMDPKTLPPCCDGTAHCVPADKVPGKVRKALATCEGGYCVPDAFLLSGGAPPASCKAFNDQAGACISTCVPDVGESKDLLEQGTCATGERCAPCIHPLTKASTGVCEIGKDGPRPEGCAEGGDSSGGDSGGDGTNGPCPHTGPPVVDPTKLPKCGSLPRSHCLDAKLVPPAMKPKLAKCATGLCVPDDFIASGGNFVPATCTSLGGIEGRCLHRVLPDVTKQADILPRATCKAEELCAPCWHPSSGADTGACKLSCDAGPSKGPPACPHAGPDVFAPSKFKACAADAHCMPAHLIPPSMAAELAVCAGGRCVPDVFIKSGGRFVPPTCDAIGGGEGRCLSRAIPKVGAQTKLTQSTCAPSERCAPCYDPMTGADTGACHRSCDKGPTEPPYVFPGCCALAGQNRGRCVPHQAIPNSQEANLSVDVCAKPGDLCVPSDNLATPFAPSPCTAFAAAYFGNYQGVCLSNCLSFSGLQDLVIKQGTCDSIHQCVPCSKPLGQPTGAPGCN